MDKTDADSAAISWRQFPFEQVADPIVRQVPYLELKLEHAALEPTAYSDQFYPDAIPYEIEGNSRVFYWQPALEPSTPDSADWQLACATTHGLAGIETLPTPSPALTTDGATGTVVVVSGTVAGDATMAHLSSYSVPDIQIERVSESTAELAANGTTYAVPSGERRRIELEQQRVEVHGESERSETVTPVLAVRYPGLRDVHHPAPGATYRLFPSFGLDIDELPNPLPVPTTADELDDEKLAKTLGVSERPYAEHVLWQAFAYTAFDPHTDEVPEITQGPQGHIVLRTQSRPASEIE